MNTGGGNNSLFVGDLSKFCTEANLESLFSTYGHVVEVKIKRNNTTGKTLSYGFVTFLTDESAALAMEHLNGYSFFGRNLRISWAVHNAKAQKSTEESVINSVYVRFITPKVTEYVTEEDFHRVFDPFGNILDVSIKESSIDPRVGRQSGYGFVHFTADNAGIAAAFQAVSAIDNATVEGVTYNVELSKNLLKQFNEMKRNGELGPQVGPVPAMAPQLSPTLHAHHHRGASDSSISSMGSHSSHGLGGINVGPRGGGAYGGGVNLPQGAGRWPTHSPYPEHAQRGGGGGYGVPPPPGPYSPSHGNPYAVQHQQQHAPVHGQSTRVGAPLGSGGALGHGRGQSGYLSQQLASAGNGMMYNSNTSYNAPFPYGSGMDSPHGLGHPSAPSPLMQGPYGQYRIGSANVAPPPMQSPHGGRNGHGFGPPAHSPYPDVSFSVSLGLMNGTEDGAGYGQGHGGGSVNSGTGSGISPRSAGSSTVSPNAQPRPLSNLPSALQLGEGGAHHPAPRSSQSMGIANNNPPTPLGTSTSATHGLGASSNAGAGVGTGSVDRSDMFPPSRAHSVSPVPGRSPRTTIVGGATHAQSLSHSHSLSHSQSHSGYARSLTDDDESVYAASTHSIAAYSPYREASPASLMDQSLDSGLSLGVIGNKPPPLNLNGLGLHNASFMSSNPPSHGGSSANSVCGGSVHGGYNTSASTSPIPTVRGGLTERLQSMKQASGVAPGAYINANWENDFGPFSSRLEAGISAGGGNNGGSGLSSTGVGGGGGGGGGSNSKPPTPASSRVMSLQGNQALRGHAIQYASSSSSSQESTPTHAYAASQGKAVVPPGVGYGHNPIPLSPKGGAISGVPALHLMNPQTIMASPAPAVRSGLHSRSSSNSSASFVSGSLSPQPMQSTSLASSGSASNSAVNSARRPALSELDIPLNRSLSSTSDRPALSTLGTTDNEAGFFSASTHSLLDVPGVNRKELAAAVAAATNSGFDAAYVNAQLLECTNSAQQLSLADPCSFPGQTQGQGPKAVTYGGKEITPSAPVMLGDLSQRSVSTIGDDDHEDEDDFPEDDELTYSASVSPLKQASANSGISFGISSEGSFNIDTSFMLSPQTSAHSSDDSPFASQSFESFRGRPPAAGITPSAVVGSHAQAEKSAHAALLMRRAFPPDSTATVATPVVDDDGEAGPEGRRPLSMCSTESSVLAGIAIDSSTSSDDAQLKERSVRPEKMRLHRGIGMFSPGGCALAEDADETGVTAMISPETACTTAEPTPTPGTTPAVGRESPTATDAQAARPKSTRQLSLTQFFKPAASAKMTTAAAPTD